MFRLCLRPIVIDNGVAIISRAQRLQFRELTRGELLCINSFIMGVDVETINPGDGELCYCIAVNCLLHSFNRCPPKLGSPGGKPARFIECTKTIRLL